MVQLSVLPLFDWVEKKWPIVLTAINKSFCLAANCDNFVSVPITIWCLFKINQTVYCGETAARAIGVFFSIALTTSIVRMYQTFSLLRTIYLSKSFHKAPKMVKVVKFVVHLARAIWTHHVESNIETIEIQYEISASFQCSAVVGIRRRMFDGDVEAYTTCNIVGDGLDALSASALERFSVVTGNNVGCYRDRQAVNVMFTI